MTKEDLLPNGFVIQNDYLLRVIAIAHYQALEINNHPIRNVPDWVRRARVDLRAKVSQEDSAAWQRETTSIEFTGPISSGFNSPVFKHALLELLGERYKLVTHTVPIEVDGFALVLERPGDARRLAPFVDPPAERGSAPVPDMSGLEFTPAGVEFRMDHKPLSQLALSMGMPTGFLIEDRTGLSGTYSFTVRDRLPVHPSQEEHEDYRLPSERYELHPFGLKVVHAKLHSTALVVDHIELPTPN